MPQTLTDIADLAQHPKWIRLCQAAMLKAAISIGNETYDGTPQSIARHGLATTVLKDPPTWGPVFAWACATNASVTLESAEADLDYIISTVWNAVAGAYTEASP